MMTAVIEVSGLTKRYGGQAVVDDISFHVEAGEIFGLLGPNGAGKTTAVECMEGLRRRDGGQVRILGLDPRNDRHRLHQRIGVQLQESQLQEKLKVREALELYASFYPDPADWRELLGRWGLTGKADTRFARLSGGQKQRLFIALALINDPEVVFLDELTTGLDPQARRAIWDLVNGIRARGKTVFLTTHLMEEAERLCDRVAIIERGRLIEMGTPADLIRRHCPERGVVFSSDRAGLADLLERIPGADSVRVENATYTVQGRGDDFVTALIRFIAAQTLTVRDFRTVFPTLEDVFLKLTGHAIRD
jgi:ABC-2 type transport system ATP-binding protein